MYEVRTEYLIHTIIIIICCVYFIFFPYFILHIILLLFFRRLPEGHWPCRKRDHHFSAHRALYSTHSPRQCAVPVVRCFIVARVRHVPLVPCVRIVFSRLDSSSALMWNGRRSGRLCIVYWCCICADMGTQRECANGRERDEYTKFRCSHKLYLCI